MKKVISLLLIVVMTFCSLIAAFAQQSDTHPVISEMYVQLGGTSGATYNTLIDHSAKKITLALPASLVGSEALKKAKITYKATADVTSTVDSIYQNLTEDVVYTVSDGQNQAQYTLSVELLSLQREYTFDSARVLALNHATKERRGACDHRGGSGSGMWYNYGYAFDSEGQAISDETFGSITLHDESAGKSLLFSKTKKGGILATTSVDGTSYVTSTDVFTSSIMFNVANDVTVGSDGIVFAVRSSNSDNIVVAKKNNGLVVGYIPYGSNTLTLNENIVVAPGEWHKLDVGFTKNDYSTSKYALDVKLNDEYLFTTSGSCYDDTGAVVECVGRLSSPKVGNTYAYTDLSTVGMALIMDSDAIGDVKIDDFKLYAQKGDETAKNDTSSTYTYEYDSDTDPGVSGGNLSEPDDPQLPVVPDKPDSPAFDGVLDLGFESDGTGWKMHRVNLVTNGGFEITEPETWRVGTSDQNREVVYSDEKAYNGSKSVYVEYPEGAKTNYQAGVRDYNSYAINPLSEYRLGMAVIYSPQGDNNYKAALSFRTKSDSTTITGESMNYCVVEDAISDWVYAEDYYLSNNSSETYVEMVMPRLNGGDAGTYAYFDDIYFGTVSHVVKNGSAGFEGDSYSGDYLLHLGAYNGLHGKDEVSSVQLDATEYRTYTVSVYTSCSAGNAKAKIGIAFYDESGKLISDEYSESLATSEWTQQSLTASAPEGTRSMKLILAAEGSGSVLFDHADYKMEEQTVESIKGADDSELLLGLDEAIDYTIPVYAADAYGMPVENYVMTFEITNHVSGVSLDSGKVVISSDVPNGTGLNIRASAGGLSEEFTLTIVRGSLEITGSSSVTKSNSDVTSLYKVYFNSASSRRQLTNDEVSWTVSGASDDISISDGLLTVSSDSPLGEYTVKSTYKQNTNIYAQFKVSITKSSGSAPSSSGGTGSKPSGGSSFGGGNASVGTVSPVTTPVQVADVPEFDDVSSDFWGYNAISYFAQKGYVMGDGSGNFRINDSITRAEFVKILLMVMELEVSEYEIPFNDVSADAWYYGYVATAYKLGLINGIDNNSFGPEINISRQDMAVIIKRALSMMDLQFENNTSKDFADKDDISAYALEAVELLSANNIINGMDDNTFRPHASATRAESVQMLYNLVNR